MPARFLSVPWPMRAAVYQGKRTYRLIGSRPRIAGPGEILIRVEACGVCHTDLKKIEYDLLTPPRIYGHETAGRGRGNRHRRDASSNLAIASSCSITSLAGLAFIARRKLYAQCPVYKKVGVTAGFEPAGGGFSQYVRVMDWIVERGVEKIPDGVPFEIGVLCRAG